MDDPRVAQAAAQFASNLRAAIGRRTVAEVAITVNMDEDTLRAFIEGRAVPDLADVVMLENALNSDLWPVLPN